jgi:iron complex transport system ATP-binding protein
LDEPTSSLDLRYQFEVLESIRQITKHRKMVTIIVLHDLNLAARYADHVLVLKKGNVVLSGAPADILTKELIRDVYGVNAMVESTDFGRPKIHFDGLFHHEKK